MSIKYTCITCRVAFNDTEIQRLHYKTDWHRYNLKRKVAELPPVTAEDFQKKVLKQREDDAAEGNKDATYCKICRKSFQSGKAFFNHSNSKKHKEQVEECTRLSLSDGSNVDLANGGAMMEISCPITGKVNKTENKLVIKDENVNDPDDEYETDSDIEEVDSDEWDDEVSENNPILNNNCLFCPHHSGTQMKNLKHMMVSHSFFIPDADYIVDLKGLLLYLGEKVCSGFMCLWCNERGRLFYSMDAAQQHMTDKGHCKMLHEGATLAEYSSFYDYSSSYPDHHEKMDVDEEVASNTIDDNDYQLVLPSGATIGHRSLMRYYRQSLDPNRPTASIQKKIGKVLSQYRSLGWTETDKAAAAKKAKDIDYMARVHKKYFMKLGTKANKLQTHFRPQVNF